MNSTFCLILYIISLASFSQTKTLQILSKKDSIPLDNVLIYNQSTSKYGYTNKSGNYNLKYNNAKDIILISLPGYIQKKTQASSLSNAIYLKNEIRELDEVIINAPNFKEFNSFSPKIKNPYKTSFISSGGALLCSINLKRKFKNDSLIGFSVKIKNSKRDAFVRPILVEVNKETRKWEFLLQTPKTIALPTKSNDIRFNLRDFSIKFDKQNNYLIGFEIIEHNDLENKIQVYGGKNRKSKLYLRADPMSDWEEVENLNYSLEYKLYIKDAN